MKEYTAKVFEDGTKFWYLNGYFLTEEEHKQRTTEKCEHIKCIVKDCQNHSDQGTFIGDLCAPCHEFITKGRGVYSQAYLNSKREWVGLTDEDMECLFLNEDGVRFARYIEAKLKEKNT